MPPKTRLKVFGAAEALNNKAFKWVIDKRVNLILNRMKVTDNTKELFRLQGAYREVNTILQELQLLAKSIEREEQKKAVPTFGNDDSYLV
jgi:hypothetical protein